MLPNNLELSIQKPYNQVMKLHDFAVELHIDVGKLTRYALNKDHPKGKHKARVFASALGFTRENYQELLQQIEDKTLEAEAKVHHTDRHGQHLQVDLSITGTTGETTIVRTGWLIAPGSRVASLSTLFVLEASE
ncbi:MAG: hypothetical protein R6X32_11440 [Chloroflexota bacterium]|jgi:hypothetical protein